MTGWHLRPVGLSSLGVVAEGLQSLWSPSCDRSVGWLALRWHLMIWKQGKGFERDEADALTRKEKMQSCTANRWKALRHSL